MTMPTYDLNSNDLTVSAVDCETLSAVPFTPATNAVFRAIRANAAMTITYTSLRNSGRTAKFAAGETRNLFGKSITAQSAGAASDIEVMY